MGGHDIVFQKVVPWSDAAVMELAPGMIFRVSGGHHPTQFVRIADVGAGVVECEVLNADGDVRKRATSPSEFPGPLSGAILKYQAIVPDCQWEAFAEFLGFISRLQLDRQQVWQIYLWFQDMAIESEMADLARRKETAG